MTELKLSEIIKVNAELGKKLASLDRCDVKILANITVSQLKPLLEYRLRSNNINGYVALTDYDNILQEANSVSKETIPLIFWELCNIKESFQVEIETLSSEAISEFENKCMNELQLLFNALKHCRLVIFNSFSHLLFSHASLRPTKFEVFVKKLEKFLREFAPTNFFILDIDKIISQIGIESSYDIRGYYNHKTLYTITYLKLYSISIGPIFDSLNGKSKKVLAFDCDNTLWKGILGEDGLENIELSEVHKNGKYFKEVHLMARQLSETGVLVGLCSKNNSEDVDEVFAKRNDFLLRPSDISFKKINWHDKASNLRALSRELNLGSDSMVFIDDSDFETSLIRASIPEITVMKVPDDLQRYPEMIMRAKSLFFNLNTTAEDSNRSKLYQENAKRLEKADNFASIDDYLQSLEIRIDMYLNAEEHIERAAQLTQKTNQFNLTTKRYSEMEIKQFMESSSFDVITVDVWDKFGNSGVTGVVVIAYEGSVALIDTFLMSCRVIGRKIENSLFEKVCEVARMRNVSELKASYRRTVKNDQVSIFYDQFGFNKEIDGETANYSLPILQLTVPIINFIQASWKKK